MISTMRTNWACRSPQVSDMKGLEILHPKYKIVEISINISIEMKFVNCSWWIKPSMHTIVAAFTSAFNCQGMRGNALYCTIKLHTNFLVPCRTSRIQEGYEPVHPNATINDNVLDKAPWMSSLYIYYICWLTYGSIRLTLIKHGLETTLTWTLLKKICTNVHFFTFIWREG